MTRSLITVLALVPLAIPSPTLGADGVIGEIKNIRVGMSLESLLQQKGEGGSFSGEDLACTPRQAGGALCQAEGFTVAGYTARLQVQFVPTKPDLRAMPPIEPKYTEPTPAELRMMDTDEGAEALERRRARYRIDKMRYDSILKSQREGLRLSVISIFGETTQIGELLESLQAKYGMHVHKEPSVARGVVYHWTTPTARMMLMERCQGKARFCLLVSSNSLMDVEDGLRKQQAKERAKDL
jgi:hypothetical protein